MDIKEVEEKSKEIRAKYDGKYHVKWPRDFKQSILQLQDEGVSVDKISKATGIARQTIMNWRPGNKNGSTAKKFKQVSVKNDSKSEDSLILSWSGGLEVRGLSFEQFSLLLKEGLL